METMDAPVSIHGEVSNNSKFLESSFPLAPALAASKKPLAPVLAPDTFRFRYFFNRGSNRVSQRGRES